MLCLVFLMSGVCFVPSSMLCSMFSLYRDFPHCLLIVELICSDIYPEYVSSNKAMIRSTDCFHVGLPEIWIKVDRFHEH